MFRASILFKRHHILIGITLFHSFILAKKLPVGGSLMRNFGFDENNKPVILK